MNGIYVIYFTGTSGSGHALLVVKDGVITGADAIGGTFDGTFELLDGGRVGLDVNHDIPPGAVLATGFANSGNKITHRIAATIPENFGNGQPIALNTPSGPVNVIFRRLREI